jgi:uncharacterized protein YlbG (UPF0298 family)
MYEAGVLLRATNADAVRVLRKRTEVLHDSESMKFVKHLVLTCDNRDVLIDALKLRHFQYIHDC